MITNYEAPQCAGFSSSCHVIPFSSHPSIKKRGTEKQLEVCHNWADEGKSITNRKGTWRYPKREKQGKSKCLKEDRNNSECFRELCLGPSTCRVNVPRTSDAGGLLPVSWTERPLWVPNHHRLHTCSFPLECWQSMEETHPKQSSELDAYTAHAYRPSLLYICCFVTRI
jgi:hypothetical protein